VVHKTQPAGSKASTSSAKSVHSGAATATNTGAKSGGVVHVWPPEALNQEPAAPK
jgi:hypothetical protein